MPFPHTSLPPLAGSRFKDHSMPFNSGTHIPGLDPALALPPLPTHALPVSPTTAASVALGLRRPRRRYEDIERAYDCSWPECTKSYGTLSHLNDHVRLQGHGAKREPSEFRELRRRKRQARKLGIEVNPSPIVLPPTIRIGPPDSSPPMSPSPPYSHLDYIPRTSFSAYPPIPPPRIGHATSMTRGNQDDDDSSDDEDVGTSESVYWQPSDNLRGALQNLVESPSTSHLPPARQTRSQTRSAGQLCRPLGDGEVAPPRSHPESSKSSARNHSSESIRAPESNLRSSSASSEHPNNPSHSFDGLPPCSHLMTEVDILASVAAVIGNQPPSSRQPPSNYQDMAVPDSVPRLPEFNNNDAPSSSTDHQRHNQAPVRPYPCHYPDCNVVYSTLEDLNDHLLRLKHGSREAQPHPNSPSTENFPKRRKVKDRVADRPYICSWPGCTKGYGKLDHLNVHVRMQGHGAKRTPLEFKHLRKVCRVPKQPSNNPVTTNGPNETRTATGPGEIRLERGPEAQALKKNVSHDAETADKTGKTGIAEDSGRENMGRATGETQPPMASAGQASPVTQDSSRPSRVPGAELSNQPPKTARSVPGDTDSQIRGAKQSTALSVDEAARAGFNPLTNADPPKQEHVCRWPGCARSYNLMSSLNSHISRQHGKEMKTKHFPI